MRQDLKGWLGCGIHAAWHTEFHANVVGASGSGVSRKGGLREISALLRLVLGEGGGIEIGLWNGDVEDSSTGRDGDWDGHVLACFGRY